jgi:hypothetical protein
LEIFKIFSVSAVTRLYLFFISGGSSEIFKIFPVSAAVAAAQPIGLHPGNPLRLFFLFSF